MKLIELKCKNCGAILDARDDQETITCKYCHANFKIDDEAMHIKYDNMESTGYEMEKGKIRARKEEEQRILEENSQKQISKEEREQRRNRLKQQWEVKESRNGKNKKTIILIIIIFFVIIFLCSMIS